MQVFVKRTEFNGIVSFEIFPINDGDPEYLAKLLVYRAIVWSDFRAFPSEKVKSLRLVAQRFGDTIIIGNSNGFAGVNFNDIPNTMRRRLRKKGSCLKPAI
jgi:hypothetical protein